MKKTLTLLALLLTTATLAKGVTAARASKGKGKGVAAPVSIEDAFVEWRKEDQENVRLSDGWLMPLYATSPTSLIVWCRHFDTSESAPGSGSGSGSASIVSKLGDDIKQSEALWFWVQALFIPHYPLYNIVSATTTSASTGASTGSGSGSGSSGASSTPLPLSSMSDDGDGYMGMMVYASAAIGVVNDVMVSLCFLVAAIFGLTGGFHRVLMEVGGLLMATTTYYALWHVCSHSALLKMSLYFVLPLNVLIMVWSIITSTIMIVGAIAGTRDMRVGEMFLYRDHWCVPGPKDKQM